MMDQDKPEGRRVVEAFHYVRDFFRNCSALLGSADIALERHGFTAYPGWAAVSLDSSGVGHPDGWLPYRVVRQYRRPDQDNLEVLTLATLPWDRWNDRFDQPLLLGTWMEVTAITGGDVYWLGVAPIWQRGGLAIDGRSHVVGCADVDLGDAASTSKFTTVVKHDRLHYVATPLLGVHNLDDVDRAVVRPLVAGLPG